MEQKTLIKFLILWIANSLVLVILSAVFKSNIVLGNANLTKPAASVLVGLILSIFVYLVPMIAKKMELKLKDNKMLALAYFIVNAVGLWIVKRLADFTGLGISSVLFVLIIAVIAALVQVGVDKYTALYLTNLKKS